MLPISNFLSYIKIRARKITKKMALFPTIPSVRISKRIPEKNPKTKTSGSFLETAYKIRAAKVKGTVVTLDSNRIADNKILN